MVSAVPTLSADGTVSDTVRSTQAVRDVAVRIIRR
jgi:hypothetical protein